MKEIRQGFRAEVNSQRSSFEPLMADKLDKSILPVGSFVDHDNVVHVVERELVGREFRGVRAGIVDYIEYVKALGDQDVDLSKVAEIWIGLSGIEGKKERSVPKEWAEYLLFTSRVDNNGVQQAGITNKQLVGTK